MHLTDEQCDLIDDAIEDVLLAHEPKDNDSRCSCGAVNNMDGDMLHGHRMGVVTAAVHNAILKLDSPIAGDRDREKTDAPNS